jgi:hypothetical protein
LPFTPELPTCEGIGTRLDLLELLQHDLRVVLLPDLSDPEGIEHREGAYLHVWSCRLNLSPQRSPGAMYLTFEPAEDADQPAMSRTSSTACSLIAEQD